eukprot:2207022-Pleurochrysis_carterae.AAC.1
MHSAGSPATIFGPLQTPLVCSRTGFSASQSCIGGWRLSLRRERGGGGLGAWRRCYGRRGGVGRLVASRAPIRGERHCLRVRRQPAQQLAVPVGLDVVKASDLVAHVGLHAVGEPLASVCEQLQQHRLERGGGRVERLLAQHKRVQLVVERVAQRRERPRRARLARHVVAAVKKGLEERLLGAADADGVRAAAADERIGGGAALADAPQRAAQAAAHQRLAALPVVAPRVTQQRGALGVRVGADRTPLELLPRNARASHRDLVRGASTVRGSGQGSMRTHSLHWL